MRKNIFVFYGEKGSGKDTCYGLFTDLSNDSCKLSFAEKLKSVCWFLFKTKLKDSERLYGAIKKKEEPIEGWEIPDDIREQCGFNEKLWSGRRLIQWFGTDVCRKIYDSIWIDLLLEDISTQQAQTICITDCRFLNEYEALRNLEKDGFNVLFFKIERELEDNEYSGHASEKEIYKFQPDHVINNCGDVNFLKEKVKIETSRYLDGQL
jgi:hypothetical protein